MKGILQQSTRCKNSSKCLNDSELWSVSSGRIEGNVGVPSVTIRNNNKKTVTIVKIDDNKVLLHLLLPNILTLSSESIKASNWLSEL